MSPEQAAGRVDDLGPATDIYSLGATLYTMLTNHTPLAGSDVGRVLQKAQRGDFLPPRRHRPDVPRPLEAICLKAMALDPKDRYASAADLAAEVEHWLADEPVAAYPEPLPARARRWGRRHRVLVTSAVAVVLVVAAAFGVLAWVVAGKNASLRAERDRADDGFAHAKQAVELFFRTVTTDPKLNENDFADLRKGLLKAAVPFYEWLKDQQGDTVEARRGVGLAYNRLALVRNDTGEVEAAIAAWRQARAVFAQLAADAPARPDFRLELAVSHQQLGRAFLATGRLKETEAAYADALLVLKNVVADFPGHLDARLHLAAHHTDRVGLLQQSGRLSEAAAAYPEVLAVQEQLAAEYPDRLVFREILATTRNNHGGLLRNLGRWKDAEAAYTAALADRQRLADAFPNRPEYRHDLAKSHNNLGSVLKDAGRLAEAEAAFAAALAVHRQLAADFPSRPDFRQHLATSQSNLASVFRDTRRWHEAEAATASALAIRKQLAAEFPTRPEYRQELARSHHNLGTLLKDTGRHGEAEVAYNDALSVKKQLAAEFPNAPGHHNDAAGTLVNLAILGVVRRDYAAARARLAEALPYHRTALQANPKHPTYRQFYRNHLATLIECCAGEGDRAGALDTAARRRDVGWDPAADAYDAAGMLAQCAVVATKNDYGSDEQRRQDAAHYADQAVAMLQAAVANGYKDAVRLKADRTFAALRERADFQKLVQDLEAAATPAPP
jgi:tetratricopeptide (TPR) repeat protein